MASADPVGFPQVLARAFSRAALQRFVPRLQGVLRREVRSWCAARRPVAVYQASKALTFRMAARILLGLRLDEAQCAELARTFEQFVENLFSLPLDVPFSGLRKVLPLWPQTFLVGLPSVGVSSRRRPVSLRAPRVASPGEPRLRPGWGGGMVWRWASGLASVLTGCATPASPGRACRARALDPAVAGFLTLGLRGGHPGRHPSTSPERCPPARPPAPLWKPGWLRNRWEH